MKAPSLAFAGAHGYAVILTPSSLPIVKHHKPAPRHILLCVWAMQPTQCVVFEDADFGIQAARAAAWTPWMFACCE